MDQGKEPGKLHCSYCKKSVEGHRYNNSIPRKPLDERIGEHESWCTKILLECVGVAHDVRDIRAVLNGVIELIQDRNATYEVSRNNELNDINNEIKDELLKSAKLLIARIEDMNFEWNAELLVWGQRHGARLKETVQLLDALMLVTCFREEGDINNE